MAKVRQNNMADQHLVVRSIEVLDGGGIGGAGGKTIERRLDQVEQSITLLNSQTDYYSQIAEDNIITPTEKQTLKKESYAINAEYTSILNRADTAGVTHSSEADAYKQCYKNLTDMWGELGIFDNMEEETRIPQRNAFNTVYQEYYESRDALNNRITIGYIGEEHGMQDIGATPALMLTYSNELIPYGNAVKTEDMIEYDPPSIRINSVITNGVYSDPYDGIIEIYRNGELAHKTDIVKNYPYVIPEGTTSLRFVLRNVTDNLIYDDEEVAVLTPDNGIQVILDNTYQTIKNGTVSQAESEYHPDFTTKIRAFNGITELQRVDFVIPTVTGFNLTFDSETKTLHYTPTDELMTEGEFSITVDIRSQKAYVLGMFNGTTVAVLGVPGAKFVIGDKYQVIKPATVHWRNYNSLGLVQLETQVNQNLNDAILANKYIGPINSTANIPGSAEIGEYFFYSGQNVPSTAPYTWAQGQLYMWTGSRWINDNNYTHKMTAMPDAVSVLNSMPNEAFYTQFIKDLVALNATIVNLFSQKITLKPISPTETAFIQGLRPDNTLGFKLDSNGHAELNDAVVRGTVYATNGEFRGSVLANDIYIKDLVPGNFTIYKKDVVVKELTKGSYNYSIVPCFDNCRVKYNFAANALSHPDYAENPNGHNSEIWGKLTKYNPKNGTYTVLHDFHEGPARKASFDTWSQEVTLNKNDRLVVECYVKYTNDTANYIPEQLFFYIMTNTVAPFAIALISEVGW